MDLLLRVCEVKMQICHQWKKTLPVFIFKITECSEFPQSEGDRHGSTSLWFLSHCCSADFCDSHCHRDRRYSKIACLLDLPGVERLYILHSFILFPTFYIAAAARPETSMHFTLLLWLCAIKLHMTVFQATICSQLCCFFHCRYICMIIMLMLPETLYFMLVWWPAQTKVRLESFQNNRGWLMERAT